MHGQTLSDLGRLRLLPAFPAVLLLVACATNQPRDPFGSPGTPAGGAGGEENVFHVRLEARCSACVIQWEIGREAGQEESVPVWSESADVVVSEGFAETARVSIAPLPDRTGKASFAWARIIVDDELVAQASTEDLAGGAGVLIVRSPIPPGSDGRIIAEGEEVPAR